MTRRRILGLSAVGVGAAVVAFAGYQLVGTSPALAPASSPVVPSARVTRGSMALTVYLQGDLRATKQVNLTAPAVGGVLRILSMTATGTQVAKDDPLMEFDPADQQFALEQAESELLEAEQEIIKRRAEVKAQEAQDKVAMLTAKFDVRRAMLDAAVDADLIAANEHKIRQAEVQEATRNQERLEQDIKSRTITSQAGLTVLEEKKKRFEMAAARARLSMENLVLRAPMAGVVAVRENGDGMMFYYEGMTTQSYRVGDTVYPGRPVADIFDLDAMEVRARVNEQERANVAVGQTARLEIDAMPQVRPDAKVSSVAGMGRPDSRYGPLRQFDVTLELLKPDPRLKPGTSVRVLVQGDTVKDVLLLPRQALFEVDGKPTVYVRAGGPDSFTPRQVKVLHRTESQIAVEGVEESTEVALVDPVAALKLSGTKTGSSSSNPMDVKK